MKRTLLFLSMFLFLIGAASAQATFMEHVRSKKSGEGTVVVNQTKEIDAVVNSRETGAKKQAPSAKKADQTPQSAQTKKTDEGKATNPDHASSATNHKDHASSATNPKDQPKHEAEKDHASKSTRTTAHQRVRTTGYRIQIFTGSNSHNDKTKAYAVGNACQKRFPELSVYARFIAPRWVCRVGDFHSREDAQRYANKIRAAGISREVRVVKSEVLVAQ